MASNISRALDDDDDDDDEAEAPDIPVVFYRRFSGSEPKPWIMDVEVGTDG